MRVFVVVEHFDRGSDEVAVRGVFQTEAKARAYIKREFPGWAEPVEDDDTGYTREGFYQDPDDTDLSDRVFIQEMEVE